MTAKIRIEIDTNGHQGPAIVLTSSGEVAASDPVELTEAIVAEARVVCVQGAGYLVYATDEDPGDGFGRRMQAGDSHSVRIGGGVVFKWIETEVAAVNLEDPFVISDSAWCDFTPSGDYVPMDVIGGPDGYLTVDTGVLSDTVKLAGVSLFVPMTAAAVPGGGLYLILCSQKPTESYADSEQLASTAIDSKKMKRPLNFDFRLGGANAKVMGYGSNTLQSVIELPTDAEGNIYFLVIAANNTTWTGCGEARLTVDFLRKP